MMIIVVPLVVCLVNNSTIFIHVYSSSRRIQPITGSTVATGDNHQQRPGINRRDIHLLRHMLMMLFSFILGWAPIYLVGVLGNAISVSLLTYQLLSLLSGISVFSDVVDLFLYNHELRRYLHQRILRCF
jgi:hypothetical protein